MAALSSESLILGTAGHIDHGKSSLVRRLSGVDPDRLAEEKERGITIELGFADFTTPSGYHCGIVDVPGHERFVRQMVAGATGVDLALLVIAADDGVMVQTREHLAVLRLLGITRFIVALTKIDLVDSEWLELVEADVAALLEFEHPRIVRVSNETGEGFESLISVLDEEAADIFKQKKRQLHLETTRFPVDRVFSIVGAGTVVTGTLWSGAIQLDDKLESVFSSKEYRVRSIQVHGQSVERASRGNRVAVNLAGATKDELRRGDVLAEPDTLHTSDTINVELEYLGYEYIDKGQNKKPKPLKTGTLVRIHHATSETSGTIHLYKEKALLPGQRAFAQLRLEEKLVPKVDDHFVIRSISPAVTIGGGRVLDPTPTRRARLSEVEFELLSALRDSDYQAAALLLLEVRGLPLTSQEIAHFLGTSRSEVADILNRSKAKSLKVGSTPYFMTKANYERILNAIVPDLVALHAENPEDPDFAVVLLKNRIEPDLPTEIFDAFLAMAIQNDSDLVKVGDRIAHKQASVSAEALDREVSATIMTLLSKQGLQVMTPSELATELGQDRKVIARVLSSLIEDGSLIRIAGEYHFTEEVFESTKQKLAHILSSATSENPLSAAEIRDALGTTRKYLIPLLEHFDRQGFTKRIGEGRILG